MLDALQPSLTVKELGPDQIKWLNRYKCIDLCHWRYILINNHPEWLYVGEWEPSLIETHSSRNDGGYSQRQKTLKKTDIFIGQLYNLKFI